MGLEWLYHFDVSDLFENTDLSWVHRRDKVVERIEASDFYRDYFNDGELLWAIDEMKYTMTEEQFDIQWDAFYDWCDAEKRVWVNTYTMGDMPV